MASAKTVAASFAETMQQIARAERISYLCIKELLETRNDLMSSLTTAGFFSAHSLPYVTMPIRWPDFSAYLSDLRHPYRRAILKSLKKIDVRRPTIGCAKTDANSQNGRLCLVPAADCDSTQFFELYLQVMRRASVTFETLNVDFFRKLFNRSM